MVKLFQLGFHTGVNLERRSRFLETLSISVDPYSLDLDLIIRVNLRILDYETNVKSPLCKMG